VIAKIPKAKLVLVGRDVLILFGHPSTWQMMQGFLQRKHEQMLILRGVPYQDIKSI
jgi:hypothetical protein